MQFLKIVVFPPDQLQSSAASGGHNPRNSFSFHAQKRQDRKETG